MQIQIYKSSTDTQGVQVDHLEVLKAIKSGRWKDSLDALAEMDEETYAIAKRNLPCAAFGGTFAKRLADGLTSYSQMIILDVDNLSPEDILTYKKSFAKDPYIHACFISPSRLGLKILVKLSSKEQSHLHAFIALEEYFKACYALVLDKSGKDVCRLCYVSYDPDMILNEESQPFVFDEASVPKAVSNSFDSRPEAFKGHVPSKDAKYCFDTCVKWTQRNHQYDQGNRNNFIHVLACNLNRAGVDVHDAILMTYNNYPDLPFKETEKAVLSAYKRQSEHKTIDVYNLRPDELPDHTEELMLNPKQRMIYDDTMTLLKAGIKTNVIVKLIKAYGASIVKLPDDEVGKIANQANDDYKAQNQKNAIPVFDIDQAMEAYAKSGITHGGISTTVQEFDDAIGGGFPRGSFIGLIADGGCYKSIYAQCIASKANDEDKIVLYLCGEMSLGQMMIRVIEKELGLRDVKIITPEITQKLKDKLKNNFFLTTSTDWTKEGILQIVDKIRTSTGKDVELICVDGITQMADNQNNEILSAISNAEICKKISKEANDGRGCVVVALVHISVTPGKHFRNTFQFCRGAKKMLNNMDAYICHSLLIDEQASDFDNNDIFYKQNIFYLRLIDKRNSGSVISKIIQVNRPLELETLSVDPQMMEVKLG